MPLSETVRRLLHSAWDDGCPCLLATSGPDGPNISPKGSLIVLDDERLAYWERSKKKAFENLAHDHRVVILYSNFKAQREQVIPSGFLRFWGTAEVQATGPVRDAIFAKLSKREQEHAGADTGVGVVVKLVRATNMLGESLI